MGQQEQQQLDAAAEACNRLEQALGLVQSMDSHALPLSTRVGAVAEMADMMTAEMKSMQEQHSAAVALHQLDAEALGKSMHQSEKQEVWSSDVSIVLTYKTHGCPFRGLSGHVNASQSQT